MDQANLEHGKVLCQVEIAGLLKYVAGTDAGNDDTVTGSRWLGHNPAVALVERNDSVISEPLQQQSMAQAVAAGYVHVLG